MFRIMEIVSRIIPLAVFLSIYNAAAANSFDSFRSVWKVIVANCMIIPFCGVMLLWVTLRKGISPREFLQKVSPVFMISFLTGFPLVVAAFYSSEYNGTPISPFQLLITFLLVIQLSVASPKVPGGIMLWILHYSIHAFRKYFICREDRMVTSNYS